MAPLDEIKAHKARLDGLLEQPYTDINLLLGLNSVVLAKFDVWVLEDLAAYRPNHEFVTIKYLDTLWLHFHYPVIKFFQASHKQVAAGKARPLQMRQINAHFAKFCTATVAFYRRLLARIADRYDNPLLPAIFFRRLAQLELGKPNGPAVPDVPPSGHNVHRDNSENIADPKIHPQDPEIHRAGQNVLSPGPEIHSMGQNVRTSVSKIHRDSPDSQGSLGSDFHANILYLLHRLLVCVGDVLRHKAFVEQTFLVPLVGRRRPQQLAGLYKGALEHYELAILLLPSLCEPYNHIGMVHNQCGARLAAVHYFLRLLFTRIGSFKLGLRNYTEITGRELVNFARVDVNRRVGDEELNLMMLELVNRPHRKNELVFFTKNFAVFGENIHKPFYQVQLITLVCVNELRNIRRFIFRYVEFFMAGLLREPLSKSGLIFLRILLNWAQANNVKLPVSVKESLVEWLNKHRRDEEYELKPVRSYYFEEDVLVKDFKIIKYQLKEFDDTHLFHNVDLLHNDYSSLVVDGVPIFLDIAAVRAGYSIGEYENEMRFRAVAFFATKYFGIADTGSFYVRRVGPQGPVVGEKHPEEVQEVEKGSEEVQEMEEIEVVEEADIEKEIQKHQDELRRMLPF